jgi:hypothetical protein
MNKNKPTIKQLKICCRHVDELINAKMSENHAIRTLELIGDMYAMTYAGGKASVFKVSLVPRDQWSLAALRARKHKPNAKAGSYLRVEHGTPRRAFARNIRKKLYRQKRLTKETMARLVKKYWTLAVVTHEEDARLERSKAFSTPQRRYADAGIRFPKNSPNAMKP